ARIRCVNITYYFIRENIIESNINLIYKPIKTILVNNLTKATSINKFKDFISRVNLVHLE
ncbi:hypothetical protein COCHEDRAFT_1104936, partial [Bipolaris maydis C5]